MNKGFKKDTIFLTKAGDIIAFHTMVGFAVKVTLSTGDSFICGSEQIIFVGDEAVLAKDLLNKHFTEDIFVDNVEDYGVCELYDLTVNNRRHRFSIMVGELIITVHNLSILPGVDVGEGQIVDASIKLYKYIPYKSAKYINIKQTTVDKNKDAMRDLSNIVFLGGPFEQIGGDDEAIGGGSQKVGSANKQ